MAESITADERTRFGKGAARKLRAAGKVPAVLYGHGTEPVHVSLPAHELGLITRRANAVLEMTIAGSATLALVKDVQRDPVRQIIEHVDLVLVRQGETVQVEVPVVLQGESFPGTVATLDLAAVLLDVEATHIPQHIVLDIEGAEDGTHVTAGDLDLPQGAKLAGDAEAIVVAVVLAPAEEAAENEEADEAAEAAEEPGTPVAAE